MTQHSGPGGHSLGLPPTPPASRDDEPPAGLALWLLAVRPKTLTIALAPVVVGTALAVGDGLRLAPLLATIVGAVLIQAGTNLCNDLGDALRGGDQPLRQGPPRVTALGWASPARVRAAALACFAAAALAGLYLAWVGGWPVLALGLASLLAGWSYSFGPRPIAYTALGEVMVVAFFGVGAVCGTVWVQVGRIDLLAPLLGVAVGLPAAAVLMVNNTRDLEPDRMVGRRTLAIRLGPAGAARAYGAMLWAALLLALAAVPGPFAWAAVAVAPWALHLSLSFASLAGGGLSSTQAGGGFAGQAGGGFPSQAGGGFPSQAGGGFLTLPRGAAFNGLLAATARYQLALAALIAAGLLLG